jgi:hypothetical protein
MVENRRKARTSQESIGPTSKKRGFLSPNFKIARSKISMKRCALKITAMPTLLWDVFFTKKQ